MAATSQSLNAPRTIFLEGGENLHTTVPHTIHGLVKYRTDFLYLLFEGEENLQRDEAAHAAAIEGEHTSTTWLKYGGFIQNRAVIIKMCKCWLAFCS